MQFSELGILQILVRLPLLTLRSGYIDGSRARNIFSQSSLPDNILAHIWSLSDINNHGKLNADEFAVAMHLLYRKLAGIDLPSTLPQELVPPSTRDFNNMASVMKSQVHGISLIVFQRL